MNRKRPVVLFILMALLAIIGIGALISGAMLFLSPDGDMMQMSTDILDGSPFSSYLFPGIVLFLTVGIYPLVVTYSLIRKPTWNWPNRINPVKDAHWAWAASWAAGVILLFWISIESLIIGYASFLQPVIGFWAIAILVFTLIPPVRRFYLLQPEPAGKKAA